MLYYRVWILFKKVIHVYLEYNVLRHHKIIYLL